MLVEELGKVDVALLQVREVASGETGDTGGGQHLSNDFHGVIVGVEQSGRARLWRRQSWRHQRLMISMDQFTLRGCCRSTSAMTSYLAVSNVRPACGKPA
jgi:hypothetical protein